MPDSPKTSRGIVVLGCRVSQDSGSAFDRRAIAGARAFAAFGASVVVASGGRTWRGVVEADALAERLIGLGLSPDVVTRERCSLSTSENAAFASKVLTRRALATVVVVTCDWHLPRALALFEREGLRAQGFGSQASERAGGLVVSYRRAREWAACRFDRVRP